jgi:hypothetical protein
MSRRRAQEPTLGRLVGALLVALFFVAVAQQWLGADRLWRWGIDTYADWRTERKVERLERRTDRILERLGTPTPSPTG